MSSQVTDKDQVEENAAATANSKSATALGKDNFFLQILNGEFMKKEFYINNLLFFFFLFGLIFLTVAKQYFVNDLVKTTEKKQKSVDQMTSDFVSLKTRLEEETERISLTEKLEANGLKESVKPTKVIRIKENN